MAQKNDDRIMQLKQRIEEKKKNLADKSDRFTPKTNCLLVIDRVTYNLHIDSSDLLLIKVNMMAMSAKNLGIDPSEFIISGYSLTDWIEDIKSYLKVQQYKEEKKNLEKLEKQLNSLLSEDKKTEMEIDSIEAMLL